MKYAAYNRNPSTALRKRPITGQKVAVAMSGGVDSGVAAALLVKRGYKVAGFHLHLWAENEGKSWRSFENKCCSTESLEAARKTAALLKIPFYTLNFEDLFKKKVVDYFLEEFSRGQTPNPCVMCNKEVKFGRMLNYISGLGYDFLATGHYARIVVEEIGDGSCRSSAPRVAHTANKPGAPAWGSPPRVTRHFSSDSEFTIYRLLQARDPQKDQSYFLYNLTQKQLAHLLFPVGDDIKEEVRKMAEKWRLPVAHRPESQEICFFPETDYRPFLKRQIPQKIKPGEVTDTEGNVIGEHDGLPLYTIGQRHGFKISSKFKVQSSKLILPLYVVRVDVKKNRLVVGWGKEAEKKEFKVKEVNWVNPEVLKCLARDPANGGILRAQVRIRHQGELYPCQIALDDPGSASASALRSGIVGGSKIKVVLDEPVRAITPGQAAVFYEKEEVLGGGVIA